MIVGLRKLSCNSHDWIRRLSIVEASNTYRGDLDDNPTGLQPLNAR